MTPEDLIKTKGIEYRYSGGDLLVKCLNPEHEDNNPSMRIDRLNGLYNCLSCGYKGNIFKLFDITPNIVHQKALQIIKKIEKIKEKPMHKPLGYDVFEQEYRNIQGSTFKEFQAFTTDRINEQDFTGRLIFPIYDHFEQIVSFIGRNMHSNVPPKYLVYPKGRSLPVYPPYVKPINGSIILVEGIFDLLNLYDKGLTNVITGFGITNITKSRLLPYKMAGASKIYIFFDGDKAGRVAAKKAYEELKSTFIVDYESLVLEEEKDPGDLTKDEVDVILDYIKN